MVNLEEYTVDGGRGLELVQRLLLSSPGCEFDPRVLKLRDRITLAILMEQAQFAALTLFAQVKKLGIKKIGFNEVAWAYATDIHADDTQLWMRDPSFIAKMKGKGFDLETAARQKSYGFIHLILPVRIINQSENETVDVLYAGRGGNTEIKNVFVADLGPLKKDQIILVHAGSVVSDTCSLSLASAIFKRQDQIRWVAEAMRDIQAIDCSQEFGSSLAGWARKNWQRHKLGYRRA